VLRIGLIAAAFVGVTVASVYQYSGLNAAVVDNKNIDSHDMMGELNHILATKSLSCALMYD